uniref:C2H2-type domain-containing protein n=1 Tax=Plectus sambesii TaxID=2011161 RepID=A0A914XA71_9BILA
MSDRASGRYAKFACSVCDYAGYSQQLLDAHLKLRGHGAVGGTGSRPDSNPAPLLGQRPAASGLLGAYGMTSGAGRPPTQSPMQSRAFPEPPSSTIPPLFNQHNRPALPPGGLLATPTALAPSMTLTQEVVETTLAKFNLPPNAVSWKGMTSEEFLQRLEDELLKRMNPADIIKQKIDAIVHSPPSALASGSRSSQESQQQSARTLQHSESPPPVTDTEELLAMALRHNDFKIARELTDLLEKEKELQARKVALAKLIPKSSAPVCFFAFSFLITRDPCLDKVPPT